MRRACGHVACALRGTVQGAVRRRAGRAAVLSGGDGVSMTRSTRGRPLSPYRLRRRDVTAARTPHGRGRLRGCALEDARSRLHSRLTVRCSPTLSVGGPVSLPRAACNRRRQDVRSAGRDTRSAILSSPVGSRQPPPQRGLFPSRTFAVPTPNTDPLRRRSQLARPCRRRPRRPAGTAASRSRARHLLRRGVEREGGHSLRVGGGRPAFRWRRTVSDRSRTHLHRLDPDRRSSRFCGVRSRSTVSFPVRRASAASSSRVAPPVDLWASAR